MYILCLINKFNRCLINWWIFAPGTEVQTKALGNLDMGIKVGETEMANKEIGMANGDTMIVRDMGIDIITKAQTHMYPLKRLIRL